MKAHCSAKAVLGNPHLKRLLTRNIEPELSTEPIFYEAGNHLANHGLHAIHQAEASSSFRFLLSQSGMSLSKYL